jgi:hypothetical protein
MKSPKRVTFMEAEIHHETLKLNLFVRLDETIPN